MQNIFNIDDRDRVAVFIDGNSFHSAARAYGFRIDYKKVLQQLHGIDSDGENLNSIQDIRYYNYLIRNDEDFAPMQSLFDWLRYNGIHTCIRERHASDKSFGHFAVDMTVDALVMETQIDHFIFIAHDIHLLPLWQELRRRACKVTIVCAHKVDNDVFAASGSTVRQAGQKFIEIGSLQSFIGNSDLEKKDG